MALDAAMLHLIAQELNSQLVGARVDKVTMPARDEVFFLLRLPQGHKRLLVSARPGGARIHLTEQNPENPAVPPAFCMLLRKYLGAGRITGFRTENSERLIFIDFDSLNEMGDRVKLTAAVELMGRYSNLVLINAEGRIIDALKRIDAEQSDRRQLLPGLVFTLPPPQNKLPFLQTSNAEILARLKQNAKPLSQALLETAAGLSPVLCREAAFRAGGDTDADRLTAGQTGRLNKALSEFRDAANSQNPFFSIVYNAEQPVEFSFVALTQYTGLGVRRFETAGELFDCYYAEKDRMERARVRSHDLARRVEQLIERTERKIAARLEEQRDTEKAAYLRLCGELITANIYGLSKGMTAAVLINYYTGEEMTVALEAALTPAENARKYFKEYTRRTTAAAKLEQLIQDGRDEQAYLRSVQYAISAAVTEEEFLQIREELYGAGFLRNFKRSGRKVSRRVADTVQYRTSGGFVVLAGKNNSANDRLTLKTAEKQDIWFHVKDLPGSHVVLFVNGAVPGIRDLTEAAIIAACHSTQLGGKMEVDYTAARYVRKPAGARPGMVVYDHHATAVVTPDRTLAGKLKEK